MDYDAERKNVGARVHIVALCLLGGHVGDGADDGASEWRGRGGNGDGLRAVADFVRRHAFGEAEVGEFDVVFAGDENIGGLDVAVHDAILVRGGEGVGDLHRVAERGFDGQRLRAHAGFQRFAVDQLHGDEGAAILIADVVHGADVAIIQRGGPLALRG